MCPQVVVSSALASAVASHPKPSATLVVAWHTDAMVSTGLVQHPRATGQEMLDGGDAEGVHHDAGTAYAERGSIF